MRKVKSADKADAQLGVATYLIDTQAIRAGNEKGEDEADTVGCCSLRVEHIKLHPIKKGEGAADTEGDDSPTDKPTITLNFLGKDSILFNKTFEVDQLIYDALSNSIKNKNDKQDVFDHINTTRLNDYLKSLMPNLSAKVFRTYNASVRMQKELDKDLMGKKELDEKMMFYDQANLVIAKLCNHQKAPDKSNVLDNMKKSLADKKKKRKEVHTLMKQLKDGKPPKKVDKNAPKTAQSC